MPILLSLSAAVKQISSLAFRIVLKFISRITLQLVKIAVKTVDFRLDILVYCLIVLKYLACTLGTYWNLQQVLKLFFFSLHRCHSSHPQITDWQKGTTEDRVKNKLVLLARLCLDAELVINLFKRLF